MTRKQAQKKPKRRLKPKLQGRDIGNHSIVADIYGKVEAEVDEVKEVDEVQEP